MDFNTTVSIETDMEKVKNKMEALYSRTSLRLLKQKKQKIKKKALFSYLLLLGLNHFSDESFDNFLTQENHL